MVADETNEGRLLARDSPPAAKAWFVPIPRMLADHRTSLRWRVCVIAFVVGLP